jgi:hypothetical protein
MRSAPTGVNTTERPCNSLFQQPWWLEAVAPGQWGMAEVRKNNQLKAWMPYVEKRGPLFLTRCSMPRLTQTLGPWIAPSERNPVRAVSERHELMAALIEQLPDEDYFSKNIHYSVQDTLPFFWAGFQTKVSYTYVIEDLSDPDVLWQKMHNRNRTAIKKARRLVEVEWSDDIETFLKLNDMVFARQGVTPPYSHEYVTQVDRVCAARGQRHILIARDSKGRPHAAIYVVFDENAAYYLMTGTDPETKQSNALALLTWEAIVAAGKTSKAFDFEGSMMRRVEPFVRSFGATQKPYFNVMKLSRRMKAIMAGRDFVSAFR